MRNSLVKIFVFSFCIIQLSCEDFFQTTLTIDPPEHTSQLAITAFGSTSTNELHVLVTNTVGLLDDTFSDLTLINDAQVSLWKGESKLFDLIEILPSSQNYYNYLLPDGQVIFEKGAEYRLEVESSAYPKASSTTIVPNDNDPILITFEENGVSNFDDDYSTIDIQFQDDINKSDFYECNILQKDQAGNLRVEYSTESFDPAAEYGISNFILNDNSFNGDLKSLELLVYQRTPQEADNLYVLWRITSEGHYLYNKTSELQNETEDNPFSTPVQIYSNVKDGIGVFSIYNDKIFKVN